MTRANTDRPAFYMTPIEAAEYLSVSRKTLDRWRKAKLVSFAQIGGRVIRYRRPDLDAMMQAHMVRVQLQEGE